MFRFLNFKKIDTYVHRMIIQNTNIGKIDLVIKLILQDQLLCFMIVKINGNVYKLLFLSFVAFS